MADKTHSEPKGKNNSPLNEALRLFEATEANLDKLDRFWGEIKKLTPVGIAFGNNQEYEAQCRSFQDVYEALPKIDGWKPVIKIINLNELAQARLDAAEIAEISAEVAIEESVELPGSALAEYRHRLNKKRRQLIRNALPDAINAINSALERLKDESSDSHTLEGLVVGASWDELQTHVQEIETLLGGSLKRPSRWSDLRRHISFGQLHDLDDIQQLDWPVVKTGLLEGLIEDDEPIPVPVIDIGTIAASQPRGEITTKLAWNVLTAEDFERLIFTLLINTDGYENTQWLTATNAPDRGRDLSVERVTHDPLSGVIRTRVIIQCKHWLTKSISAIDVASLKEQMVLCEPPKVDSLIIATSGRFTSDAVAIIEKHNNSDRAMKIEMWPESRLEELLARRPGLVAQYKLR